MARKNIFQIVKDSYNIGAEIDRMDKFFSEEILLRFDRRSYTIMNFIDSYIFPYWKNRSHCIDVDDFLLTVDYYTMKSRAKIDINTYLTFIELMYNFWEMVNIASEKYDDKLKFYSDFYYMQDIMNEELSHYNYKAYYDEVTEQVLVIEDKAEATAVAEILEDDLSFEVIRYNHHSLNGDIKQKKAILLELGSKLESKRKLLESFNKGLSSDIFYILNNLNLRHNNCAKGTNNYKEAVALMQEDTLESWYDELYQMILLAFLELEHQERKKKVDQLKQETEGVK